MHAGESAVGTAGQGAQNASPESFHFPMRSRMYTAIGYAAQTPTSPLAPMTFERRSPRPDDVAIEIL